MLQSPFCIYQTKFFAQSWTLLRLDTTAVNLIKLSTIVNYDSRVIITRNFPEYDL